MDVEVVAWVMVAELVLQLVADVAICCFHCLHSCQHFLESSAWLSQQAVHVEPCGEDLVTSCDLEASVACLFQEMALEALPFVAHVVAAVADKVAGVCFHVHNHASVHSAACCSTSLRPFLWEGGTLTASTQNPCCTHGVDWNSSEVKKRKKKSVL